MSIEAERTVIAETSLDIPTGRLPEDGVTLEEYRRLGGVPVSRQVRTTCNVVTGTSVSNQDAFAIKIASGSDVTTRSGHAIVHEPKID